MMKPKETFVIDDYSILVFEKNNVGEHVEVWPRNGIADNPCFILNTSDKKTIKTCIEVYQTGFVSKENEIKNLKIALDESKKHLKLISEMLNESNFNLGLMESLAVIYRDLIDHERLEEVFKDFSSLKKYNDTLL